MRSSNIYLTIQSKMNVNQSTESSTPLFLNISILRLVLLSIASCGLYEAYWIYKNWRYIKERDGLEIRPFWRVFFAYFSAIVYCIVFMEIGMQG
jgi:hypothetical protein